jgi:hypothetical protein
VTRRRAALSSILAATLLGLGPPAQAGEIRFTFGLTRSIDACEERGAIIRYQSGGQWYEIPKAEVHEITGLTCTAGAAPATALAATPPAGSGSGWEPDRYVRMAIEVAQAGQRGNLEEAERGCGEISQYVLASVTMSLHAYADLLGTLRRPEAGAARERAERLQNARPQPGGSVPLGFDPSAELRTYASLLREVGRGPYAASSMTALADAWQRTNQVAYYRAQEQARGGDTRGRC